MVRQVVEQGIAVKGEDMPLVLQRNGYPELCHFTFSYSPIRNIDGQIDGMFTAAVETSERVRAERRLAFQLRLADALRSVHDPVQVAEHAAALLGDHIGAGRTGYGHVDERLQTVTVEGGWTDGCIAANRVHGPQPTSGLPRMPPSVLRMPPNVPEPNASCGPNAQDCKPSSTRYLPASS